MKQIFAALIALVLLSVPIDAQQLDEPLNTYVRTQEAQIDVHFGQGDYEGAEALLRPLIVKLTNQLGPSHTKTLRTRQALSNTLNLLGRPGDALREMEDAYKVWEKHYLKFNPYRMDAAMQLAVHLSRMGYANDGLALAVEATKFAEAMWGLDNKQTMLWQYNTAGIMGKLGYDDQALALMDKVLPHMDAQASDPRIAHYACALTRERSRTLRNMGRFEDAAQAYADAVRRAETCYSENHPEQIYTYSEYALALYNVGDIPAMGPVLERARRGIVARFGENSLQYADYLNTHALYQSHDALGTPAFDAAIADMRASVALRERLLSATHSFTGKAYLELAAMEKDRENYGEAWQLALKAEAAGSPSRTLLMNALAQARDAGALSAQEALAQAFRLSQLNHHSAARAAYATLANRVQISDSAKTDLMREFTDKQRRQSRLQQDISYFVGLSADERRPDIEREIRAEMEALSAEINRIGEGLKQVELPFESLYRSDPLSLAEAQAMLGPDEALVIFDIGERDEDWDFVFVATRDAAVWREMPLSMTSLNAAISDLRGSIDLRMGVRSGVSLKKPTGPDKNAYDLNAAHWIYEQTFAVIEDLLEGKSHIYTELRGPLSSVPPQLLVRNDTTQLAQADWLVRHHAVTVIPSIESLRLTTLARQGTRAAKPFLGFADPIFGDMDSVDSPQAVSLNGTRAALRGSLAPLPETAVEVRAVAEAVGASAQGAIREQTHASEAQLKSDSLSDYRVLYFATHGLVAGDMVTADQELDEPALALTAGQGEDGMLTASEIASLRLNADWVVLSACNTAVGDEPGAEALSGLAQAFTYAGARALMVSHWPVDSRSAVALMTDLFARRANDPTLTAAQAQRQAILAMIDHPQRAEWSHPAYWAPFILVGNPD